VKRAAVICPGRGTYNKEELGSLQRLHPDKSSLLDQFDAIRSEAGQASLRELDGAERFSVSRHTRGDNASALIFAATYADYLSLKDIEVVAVTGNSMGWYSALACGGALSPENGFQLVNTMGTLMQTAMIGGQIVYPVTGDDWRTDRLRRAEIMTLVETIHRRTDHFLALSIDLGGMLVLAGNEAGLSAFEKSAPIVERFPMRLANHAAFHTSLQAPIAQKGRAEIPSSWFGQPEIPLIDGRGAIWWPHASSLDALWDYTLGHQVVEPYDFAKAIAVAAREFAPDCFIVAGPGTTLGGSVAQSLIASNWRSMASKEDFLAVQEKDQMLISLGREDQRNLVI